MFKKIDIKSLNSLAILKNLIEQVNDKADQYLFTEDDKIIAVLSSPTYFDKLVEKDIQDTINEMHNKQMNKRKVIEFIKQLRIFNKDTDPEKLQKDIDEAVREVKKFELKKLQLKNY